MNRRTYRKKWLRLHVSYSKLGLKVFSKAIQDSMSRIPWENLNKNNFEFLIKEFITNQPFIDAYTEFYVQIGLRHGKLMGQSFAKEQKSFDPFSFDNEFTEFIRSIVLNNFGQKITSVRTTFVEAILETIAEMFSRREPPRNIAREIQGKLNQNKIYRWQLLRIARTETTGAANLGAIKASESSDLVLEKEWISNIDHRTRRKPPGDYDHVDMDGVTVDENSLFNVNGDQIAYPGDPEGHIANIVNCRCTIALVAKRDSEGRLISKDQ